ncbi:MAG TPA: aldo/keto reductase [Ilumatobacteraceae bacterium]|nr:aldo/keto reductase [Ilumatobacteraceae bacterium]
MSLTGGLPTRIGLGTAPISSHRTAPHWWGPQDRDVAVAAVRAAVDAGVGWIDTAPMYGWGRAEEIVAEALSGRVERPLVFTKCGTFRAGDGSFYTDNSPDAVRRDVEGSLRRLGVERLDLVQVHDEDPSVPVEETWTALDDLVREGLVGAAGLSNHRVELLDRALAVGPVATVQNQYSLVDRSVESDGTLDWCERHRVAFLSWGSLGAGFLADGFELSELDPDDLRHRLRWAGADAALTARTRDAIASIASAHGCTMVAVALAWLTTRTSVYPIVGARTPAEAMALVEPLPALDADELARLEV